MVFQSLRALSAHDACATTSPSACAGAASRARDRRAACRRRRHARPRGAARAQAATRFPAGSASASRSAARSCAIPKVFLFDEPLSNLDASLRVSTRGELIKLHRRLGATMIYVTHDQVEAMTMGGRICIMNDGKVVQIGAPLEVYRDPADTFVAGFLGNPPMNLLPARLDGDGGSSSSAQRGSRCRPRRSRTAATARTLIFGVRPGGPRASTAPGAARCDAEVARGRAARRRDDRRAAASTASRGRARARRPRRDRRASATACTLRPTSPRRGCSTRITTRR